MRLTAEKIKTYRPKAARYAIADGRGLFLDVTPGGSFSWFFRYNQNGRREKLNLGPYPEISLKRAREKRDEYAVQVAEGNSPAEEKRKAKRPATVAPTLREFGDRYYREQVERTWKNPTNERRNLEKYLYPMLGDRQLKEITALDIQAVVYPIRDGGRPAQAMKVRNTAKRMYDYAIELHLSPINPAAMVATRYIGKAVRRSRHLKAGEIREFLHVVYQSNIRRQFKLALHIVLLTLIRKSMLLLATWDEFDFDRGEWTIPKEHMKGKKGEEHEHVVYLSTQVAAMFHELKALAGNSQFVLPGRNTPRKPFAQNALNKALEGLSFDMEPFTIHDLRRTASTELANNGFRDEWIEKALSHEKEGIKGVYNRAEYAKQRKQMLQWWADHVDSIATESKVIVGNFGRS